MSTSFLFLGFLSVNDAYDILPSSTVKLVLVFLRMRKWLRTLNPLNRKRNRKGKAVQVGRTSIVGGHHGYKIRGRRS